MDSIDNNNNSPTAIVAKARSSAGSNLGPLIEDDHDVSNAADEKSSSNGNSKSGDDDDDDDEHASSTQDDSVDSYKKQVIALMQEVSPEDIEHVDDMLEAFQGQEEDLLKLLQSAATNELPRVLELRAASSDDNGDVVQPPQVIAPIPEEEPISSEPEAEPEPEPVVEAEVEAAPPIIPTVVFETKDEEAKASFEEEEQQQQQQKQPPPSLSFRDQVQTILQERAPEELANLDEMVAAFEGNEQELLDTLYKLPVKKTKQVQASTKELSVTNAKELEPSSTEQNVVTNTESKREIPAVVNVNEPPAVAIPPVPSISFESPRPLVDPQSLTREDERPGARRSSAKQRILDEAIEDGDWAAVAMHAASLVGDSASSIAGSTAQDSRSIVSGITQSTVNTVSIPPINNYVASESSRSLLTDDGATINTGYTAMDEAKIQELEDLIDSGDWQGLVNAATFTAPPNSS